MKCCQLGGICQYSHLKVIRGSNNVKSVRLLKGNLLQDEFSTKYNTNEITFLCY